MAATCSSAEMLVKPLPYKLQLRAGEGRKGQEDIPSQAPIVMLTVQADSPGTVRRAKASSKAMHAVP